MLICLVLSVAELSASVEILGPLEKSASSPYLEHLNIYLPYKVMSIIYLFILKIIYNHYYGQPE